MSIKATSTLPVHQTTAIAIEGVTEPTLLKYFETFNAEAFDETAALFAPEGLLYPPFEEPIAGLEAIANYLKTEASGMHLEPLRGEAETLETGDIQYVIRGKVHTPLFSVNLAWYFVLNEESQILAVGIKLLASLEELLQYKPGLTH